MITTKNYFQEIEKINVDKLPVPLQKGHDLVRRSTNGGSDWNAYEISEPIRRAIDQYLEKLNQYLATQARIESESEPKQKLIRKVQPKAPQAKKAVRTKPKVTKKETKPKKPSKKVEHLREEVKFIKRFVGLHNKVKTPHSIILFIRALQRAIVQKLIRKTSPLAEEIQAIQDKLIRAYNSAKGDMKFEINAKDLARLVSIAGGEEVYPSINIMKRYIGLQGKKLDDRKLELFTKHIENALNKERVQADDPYYDKVKAIYNTVKRLKADSTVRIAKAELNGLEGIVKACKCKPSLGRIYRTGGKSLRPCNKKTYTDARNKGACSHNGGLSGVLTAEEMATRQLDLLDFYSVWLELFGRPARNFTMMFHGEPHNGKTILLLKFAQFLADKFGEVLYVSSEEFASPTMTSKVNEFLAPFPERLHFSEDLDEPELSDYDFIILDSVNDLGLKVADYKEIRRELPDTAFILILQHTKAGDFRGGKDWEHIAEVVGEVDRGTISITKNRYAPKNSLDFFEHFGIAWKEPEYNYLPYQN